MLKQLLTDGIGGNVSARVVFVCLFILACTGNCMAQDASSPKVSLFGGAGANVLAQGHAGTGQFGASLEEAPPNSGFGLLFEAGGIVPWANAGSTSAFLSANYAAAWSIDKRGRFLPFATVGYSRVFGAGNAMNFGGGLDYRLTNTQAIRIEARDYWLPTESAHDVAMRVGWVIYLKD